MKRAIVLLVTTLVVACHYEAPLEPLSTLTYATATPSCGPADGPPVLLVTDLSLPGKDGFALVDALRARNHGRADVIAWSSLPELREFAAQRFAGLSVRILRSSVGAPVIHSAIARALGRTDASAAPSEQERGPGVHLTPEAMRELVEKARSISATQAASDSKSAAVARSAATRAATTSRPSRSANTSTTEAREIGATVAPTCATLSTNPGTPLSLITTLLPPPSTVSGSPWSLAKCSASSTSLSLSARAKYCAVPPTSRVHSGVNGKSA